MKIDLGDVLSSAFQITWRHKILWVFSALPALLSFLIFPVMFVPLFLMDKGSPNPPFFIEEPVYIILFILFNIVIVLLSYGLYGISSSAVVLGVIRADKGEEGFTFRGLFNDSKPYWWRVLGVLLLIGLGVSLVFMMIFGCVAIVGAVTAGIGFICVMPFMLLIYPLMLILYGVIEESQVAVIADDLGVTESIRRGWELVRDNFWGILLVSLIVYFGISILSGVIMFPFMTPFFFIPFFIDGGGQMNPRTMMLFMGGFSSIFITVMDLYRASGSLF